VYGLNFELTEVLFFKPEPYRFAAKLVQALFNEFSPKNLTQKPVQFPSRLNPIPVFLTNRPALARTASNSLQAHALKMTSSVYLVNADWIGHRQWTAFLDHP